MFLLDIVEVPESHSGTTLAHEFQAMLEQFQLEDKVCTLSMLHHCPNFHICQMLGFTSDNATVAQKTVPMFGYFAVIGSYHNNHVT